MTGLSVAATASRTAAPLPYDATQQHVTGEVTLRLAGGSIRPVARESPHAAYSPEAASFDTAAVGEITQQDAIGVAKYHGFQSRLAADHRDGA